MACGSPKPPALICPPSPRVMDHLLAAGQPEQRQCGGDLRESVVIDVVGVVEYPVWDPGDLPQPAGGVGVGEAAHGDGRGRAGLGLVGGHEGEQFGDRPQVIVDEPGVDHLSSLPVAAGPGGPRVGPDLPGISATLWCSYMYEAQGARHRTVRGDAMNSSRAGASLARAGTHEARVRVRGLCCLAQEAETAASFSGYPSCRSAPLHTGDRHRYFRGTGRGGGGQIGSHDRSERRIMIHNLSWPVWRVCAGEGAAGFWALPETPGWP